MTEGMGKDLYPLITDSVAYLQYLNETHRVTVHGLDKHFGQYMHHFMPYNVHISPFCLYIKGRNTGAIEVCTRYQRFATNHACKQAYFGTCLYGMSEYVFPVPLDRHGKKNGIVCVSGYHGDPAIIRQRIHAAAERFGLDEAHLSALSIEQASVSPSNLESLSRFIHPLSRMLTQIALTITELQQSLTAESASTDAFYSRIIKYLDTHYKESITMETLARDHHCSVSFLSHLFKARSGFPLREYINQLRVRDAVIYLEHTDMSISEIAFMTGFSDSNYFSTVFAREKQCSPSQYRKWYRSEQRETLL